jgi:hypothetical protein
MTRREGCNPSSLLSLTLHITRVPLTFAPQSASTPRLILLRGCVWHDFPHALISHDGSMDRRFTSPSLIKFPSTYQPDETFNSGPASRFWFSGPVESKYGINSRWKLTPPFQVPSTAIMVSFSAHPLSAVLQ